MTPAAPADPPEPVVPNPDGRVTHPLAGMRAHSATLGHAPGRRVPAVDRGAARASRLHGGVDAVRGSGQPLDAARGRGAVAGAPRAYGRGARRPARAMEQPSVRTDDTGRIPLRSRRRRHEGQCRGDGHRAGALRRPAPGAPGIDFASPHQRRGRTLDQRNTQGRRSSEANGANESTGAWSASRRARTVSAMPSGSGGAALWAARSWFGASRDTWRILSSRAIRFTVWRG